MPSPPFLGRPLGRGLGVPSRAVASPFNALSYGTVQMWIDASDATTRSLVSGAVAFIGDKSGSGNVGTQTTASQRPSLVTGASGIGGLAAMQFGFSASKYLALPSGALPSGDGAYHVFVVMRPDAAQSGSNSMTLNGGVGTGNASFRMLYLGSDFYHDWQGNAQTYGTVSVGRPVLLDVSYNQTSRWAAMNGVESGPNSPGTTRSQPTSPNYIAASVAQSEYGDVTIGEIIVYDARLGQVAANAVRSALMAKWSIA